jgi:hypothetical protein
LPSVLLAVGAIFGEQVFRALPRFAA